MTQREPLVPLLRELDDELTHEHMSPGARHRIASVLRERTQERSATRRWLPMLSFACGAALVLAVLALGAWRQQPEPVEEVAEAHPSLGAFAVQGERCRTQMVERTDDLHQLHGPCRLVGAHMTISSWDDAVVRTWARNVDVRRGRVLFDVEKVRPHEDSITVDVPGGVIEVVGTRFEVDVRPGGGHVDLFEGRIRFHESDGSVVEIEPGTRHTWGDERNGPSPRVEPDDDEVEIIDDEPRRPRASASPRRTAKEAAEIIEQVERLRRAGRTAEGVAILRRAVAERWDRRTAQVLSFELGEFLYRYVGDHQAACEHFATHQRRFPRGRYRKAVKRTRDRLECG